MNNEHIENTLPEVFKKRVMKMMDNEYADFVKSLCIEPKKALRLNPLKSREEDLEKTDFSLQRIEWEENGYIYSDKDEPGKSSLHMAGMYYIQEPSAMAPVTYLNPQKGDRVLDLCAAPGGKSTQIAGKLGGEGILISNEINAKRAKILAENIERLGIRNAMVLNETPQHLSERFEGWFDKILVDAPCSGEGMFRKNAEAISEWSPENVELCADRQDEILDYAEKMLAPNGIIVYSTCTFAPDEDEGTIYRFLLRHRDYHLLDTHLYSGMDHGVKDFAKWKTSDESTWTYTNKFEDEDIADSLTKCIRLWPHHLDGEGHFLAILKKNEVADNGQKIAYCFGGFQKGFTIEKNEIAGTKDSFSRKSSSFESKNQKAKQKKNSKRTSPDNGRQLENAFKIYQDFANDTLTSKGISKLNGTFFLFGEQVYLAPDIMPSTTGLKVMRPGLHLGTLKKDRLEPSHALALYLDKDDVKRRAELPAGSNEVNEYTTGLTININLKESGWCLITTNDFSLGWAKSDGKKLKNHYPKGLRNMI